jgi:hypothetical protein
MSTDVTKLIIKAPLATYRSDRSATEALSELNQTKANRGAEIKQIASIHGVPLSFGFAVTTVESKGLSIRSQDGVSYGVMQCNAATLDGVVVFAMKNAIPMGQFYPIYSEMKSAFTLLPNANLPTTTFWDTANASLRQQPASFFLKYKGKYAILTDTDYNKPTNKYNQLMISKPSFGMHVGMLFLYWLCTNSIFQEGGRQYIRTDWVINGYNGGYYKKGNPWITGSQKSIPPERWLAQPSNLVAGITKTYVKRISGVGGYLELIKQGKFVLP